MEHNAEVFYSDKNTGLQEVTMRHSLPRIILSVAISVFFALAAVALADVDEHIVLWLQFDEGAGGVTADSSNYGNDGTIVGPTWTEGKYGSVLLFDGIDDYVEVASNVTESHGV